jgi:hypothetical protein
VQNGCSRRAGFWGRTVKDAQRLHAGRGVQHRQALHALGAVCRAQQESVKDLQDCMACAWLDCGSWYAYVWNCLQRCNAAVIMQGFTLPESIVVSGMERSCHTLKASGHQLEMQQTASGGGLTAGEL